MAVPKFVLGADVLQFSRGIRYPVAKPSQAVQAVDRTGAGTLEVESLGPNIRHRRLTFKDLPLADYTALVNWYEGIAEGAANQFTYYDETGTPMAVRMLSESLDFQEISYQRYAGELLLEVVG
ncbi:MAG: hypothetical protein C4563_06425 [Desulfobulbus sp.]|jgi:hypothetical protein|nr:MAG: hypothetical protein C4563_06425 [Desulfobulbus sp.]